MSSPKPKKSKTTTKAASKAAVATTDTTAPKKKIVKRLPKRIIVAHKGEDVHWKKLVVQNGEQVEIQHGGGTLVVDEVEVKKGGTFLQDLAKAPPGFTIGSVNSSGGKSVMKF